jgi:hypothetical protein
VFGQLIFWFGQFRQNFGQLLKFFGQLFEIFGQKLKIFGHLELNVTDLNKTDQANPTINATIPSSPPTCKEGRLINIGQHLRLIMPKIYSCKGDDL